MTNGQHDVVGPAEQRGDVPSEALHVARRHVQLTLRRVVVDGASAEQRRCHIYTADIREHSPAR